MVLRNQVRGSTGQKARLRPALQISHAELARPVLQVVAGDADRVDPHQHVGVAERLERVLLVAQHFGSAVLEDAHGQRWGLECWELPAGRFPSLDAPIRVLDFSGWAILATETLPDRIAALIAEAVVEAAPALERHYRHLPVESSPLSYPLDWREARRTHVPLHPAAAKV